jgi:phage gp29-like protein
VRSCSIPWVVRQFALRDWGRFSEVHGLPIKKLMVPSQAPAQDKARFFASVQRLGSEAMFSLPQQGDGKGGVGPSFDVQLLEARDNAWKAFPGLIAQCERSITLAIRGTNLTTEVDGGSFAAADVHKDEDSDYAIADRRKLAQAVYIKLLRPFCDYNYGNPKLAPKPTLASPESDQEKEGKVLVSVAQSLPLLEDAGWPIDRKVAGERFGIPLRADVEANKPIEQHEAEQDATMAGLEAAKNVGKESENVGESGDVDREDPKPIEDAAAE